MARVVLRMTAFTMEDAGVICRDTSTVGPADVRVEVLAAVWDVARRWNYGKQPEHSRRFETYC